MRHGFEWDAAKAAANKQKHSVDFETALLVFFDPYRIDFPDPGHSEDEERWQVIGCSTEQMLFVVYVEKKNDIIRLISARKASKNEQEIYRQSKRRPR